MAQFGLVIHLKITRTKLKYMWFGLIRFLFKIKSKPNQTNIFLFDPIQFL